MPVTLVDIARIANISESSVSRALLDNPRISLATRERVKKIAAELDFEYNAHARSLSTKRSATVGVILSNIGSAASHTYYLEMLVNDLRRQLAASDYDMILCDFERRGAGDSNLSRLVRQRKVDGLLLVVADLLEKDRKAMEQKRVPIVLVNSHSYLMSGRSIDDLPSFFTDNLSGGALAGRHLAERGCRRILCLADPVQSAEMLDRSSGLAKALAERDLAPTVLHCPTDFAGTYAFARERLDELRTYDGVFCHTDVMACAAMRALIEGGARIPEDIKVIGFDDIELGTYFSPQLTTIHQPHEAIAEQAVGDLMRRISGSDLQPISHVSIAPNLVVRGSA
jgi:LacI family transcriptional regulator